MCTRVCECTCVRVSKLVTLLFSPVLWIQAYATISAWFIAPLVYHSGPSTILPLGVELHNLHFSQAYFASTVTIFLPSPAQTSHQARVWPSKGVQLAEESLCPWQTESKSLIWTMWQSRASKLGDLPRMRVWRGKAGGWNRMHWYKPSISTRAGLHLDLLCGYDKAS